QEKIPILPFEVRISFLGIIPSQTIANFSDIVLLKRNQVPNPILNDFYGSSFLKLKKNNDILGYIIGYILNEDSQSLEIVYSDLNPEKLFEKLGKDTKAIDKLYNRIQRALNVKSEESKTPKAIITYLTFYSVQFATYEDLSQFSLIESWLIKTFELKTYSFENISTLDEENNFILVD
ncbi:MAG: hypothetical protein ACFFD1_02420, partial [Candidatus Thorarchaeota archaeon]